jgi:hypothetical protein
MAQSELNHHHARSCYLCGRDYGIRSIGIHVPNCLKKWEDEQKRLPRRQRRSPPERPEKLDRVMEGLIHGEELKEFNEAAVKKWNTAVLVMCEHCLRTFFPEKVGKHQTSCTKSNPMKNLNKTTGKASMQEALVNYPQQKKIKSRNQGSNPSQIVRTSAENEAIIRNLLEAKDDNELLKDRKLSSQLIHLMDCLIESKLRDNKAMIR